MDPVRNVGQASSIATTRPEVGLTRTPSNNPSGLWRCQVRSTSVLAPRSVSRAASNTSLSQYGLEDGSMGEQDGPAGTTAVMDMSEGTTAGSTETTNGTTGTAPANPPQTPHSSASPTAIGIHSQRLTTGPSGGQRGTAGYPAIPIDCKAPNTERARQYRTVQRHMSALPRTGPRLQGTGLARGRRVHLAAPSNGVGGSSVPDARPRRLRTSCVSGLLCLALPGPRPRHGDPRER